MSIRRILVALDDSAHSLAALEAAALLAARTEAELLGIFVEDINLLHLAQLPFALEWGFSSATRRPLDSAGMERSFRGLAQRAERALAATARRLGLRYSFRVSRGPVAGELLQAALQADLLALGIASHALGRRPRLGSTALRILAQAPGAVLLLQQGLRLHPPALFLLGSSRASLESLPAAADLALIAGGELLLLIVAADADSAQTRLQEARAKLQSKPVAMRHRLLPAPSREAILRAVCEEKAGALVLCAEEAPCSGEELQKLVEQTGCPVFVVRPVQPA